MKRNTLSSYNGALTLMLKKFSQFWGQKILRVRPLRVAAKRGDACPALMISCLSKYRESNKLVSFLHQKGQLVLHTKNFFYSKINSFLETENVVRRMRSQCERMILWAQVLQNVLIALLYITRNILVKWFANKVRKNEVKLVVIMLFSEYVYKIRKYGCCVPVP